MTKVSRHIVDVAGEDSSRVGLGIDKERSSVDSSTEERVCNS